MLALSDEALCRVVIAATRIAPQQRSRWLQRIARELEGHEPSPTARRLRRLQSRRRSGQKCFRLTLDEVDTEEMLLASGILAPADRDDHGKVEAALAKLIRLMIEDHRNAFQRDEEIYASVRTELALSALEKALSHASPKRVRK